MKPLAAGFALAIAVAFGCSIPAPTSKPESVSAAAQPVAGKPPPEKLTYDGTYRESKTIMVVCDQPDWCENETEDVMRIRTRDDGSLWVKLDLVQTNAHTCGFEGALTQVANTEAWVYAGNEGEMPCELRLERKDGTFELSSEGCRYYCGARAHLWGNFSIVPADPSPAAFDCDKRCNEAAACRPGDFRQCVDACWQKERSERDKWDVCVRRAGKDCQALAACG